jgi:hypothetical protein
MTTLMSLEPRPNPHASTTIEMDRMVDVVYVLIMVVDKVAVVLVTEVEVPTHVYNRRRNVNYTVLTFGNICGSIQMVTIVARGFLQVATMPIPDVGEGMVVVTMEEEIITVMATANQTRIKTFTPAMVDDRQISTALHGTIRETVAVMPAMDSLQLTTMESAAMKD